MLSFLEQYSRNYVFSQNGEEGVLLEAVKRLGIAKGQCVEIGGNDGRFCSNTALLIEDQGWAGTFIEADYSLYQQCKKNWAHRANVKSICSRVSAVNVNAFVPKDCDVLSLDTDGSDYAIFEALANKPKVVIVEIDSSIPPDVEGFNSDGGASYRKALQLGIKKGYFLLAHTGNLVFVANEYRDLFPEVEGDGLNNSELYFNRGWLKEDAA